MLVTDYSTPKLFQITDMYITNILLYTHIFNIIIIEACREHRFLLLSLAIHPYRPPLFVNLLDGIQFLQKFHVNFHWSANTGVSMCRNPSRKSPMSLSLLKWFVRWEVSSHTAAVLEYAVYRIRPKHRAVVFLYSSYQTFSLGVLFESKWCNHTIVLICLQFGKIPFFLFRQRDQISK